MIDRNKEIGELYRLFFEPLCASIRKAFGSGPPDPDEIAQSAFTKYLAMENTDHVQNPKAFLFTIARNLVMDSKRRMKRGEAYVAEQLAIDPDLQLEKITPERVLFEKQRFELLLSAIKTLPHKQQVVLTMNRLHGKTYEQINKETGWSLGDISRNLNAAKAALLDILENSDQQLAN